MALISDPNNPVSPQGVLAIAVVFTIVVWLFAGARFWALRHNTSRRFSPRWISNAAVVLILVFVSMSLFSLFYAYHIVYRMRDLQNVLDTLDSQRSEPSMSNAELESISAAEDNIITQLNSCALSTMKSSLAWRLSSTTALWLVKFSIVMVYVELWDSFTMYIQCFMYVSLWTIGLTYVVIITCLCIGIPAENWGLSKTSYLPVVTEYTYGAANIVTNVLILTIALWSLYILKLPQSKLYAVSLLLFIGLVTLSLAIARTILYDVHSRRGEEVSQSVDIIGLVEPLVASWLACLPALRVLFRCRQPSGAEELGVRTSDVRCFGHSRISSSGDTRQNDSAPTGGKGDEGDLECDNTSNYRGEEGSGGGSSGSNIDNRISSATLRIQTTPSRSCDHFGREIGDPISFNSLNESNGSTQIGDWEADAQSEAEILNLGRLQPRCMATESHH